MIHSVEHSAVEEQHACKDCMDDIIMLISLYIVFCLICGEIFLSLSGLSSGPSAHRELRPLIISLFFIMILLVLFCFPPGMLPSYDQPWNK